MWYNLVMKIRRKRSRAKMFFGGLIIFVVMFAGAFFGIQFFTKTGIFRVPGVVYYDESFDYNDNGILDGYELDAYEIWLKEQ